MSNEHFADNPLGPEESNEQQLQAFIEANAHFLEQEVPKASRNTAGFRGEIEGFQCLVFPGIILEIEKTSGRFVSVQDKESLMTEEASDKIPDLSFAPPGLFKTTSIVDNRPGDAIMRMPVSYAFPLALLGPLLNNSTPQRPTTWMRNDQIIPSDTVDYLSPLDNDQRSIVLESIRRYNETPQPLQQWPPQSPQE